MPKNKKPKKQHKHPPVKKAPGETYADVLAKRKIGEKTLELAMHDEAVNFAADIKTQRMLWAAVVALNEQFQFGPKRTQDFMTAMDEIVQEFYAMKEENGDAYAEEKLRQRASQVSGLDIQYQHEVEIATLRAKEEQHETDD